METFQLLFTWFDAAEAKEAGVNLADFFTSRLPAHTGNNKKMLSKKGRALQQLLSRAEQIKHTIRLNVYKKAQLGNAFKWRLLDTGYDKELADELTREIILALK